MQRSAEQRSRHAAKERERHAVESPASRQARLASDKAAARDRRAAETPRLVRLGWIPTRLQLGDAVTRLLRSPASLPSGGSLVCALSFVVRMQMLLRLGVRAVTPLITTLDRSRLPGQIFQISFLGRSFSYTSQGHEKVILVLRRVMLEKNGHDHFFKYLY